MQVCEFSQNLISNLEYGHFALHKIIEIYKANSIATLFANMNYERDCAQIHSARMMNHECSTKRCLWERQRVTIVN